MPPSPPGGKQQGRSAGFGAEGEPPQGSRLAGHLGLSCDLASSGLALDLRCTLGAPLGPGSVGALHRECPPPQVAG